MNSQFTPWTATPDELAASNLGRLMRELGFTDYRDLHRWSVENRESYWERAIAALGIRFTQAPERVLDASGGPTKPVWLPGARLNIAESCLAGDPGAAAIIHQAPGGPVETVSFAELDRLSGRVAAGLRQRGLGPGSAVAIHMPMTADAVAIYLGILRAGCAAVGVADSFRPPEVATRLRVSKAQLVFTQGVVTRQNKRINLYENLIEAGAPPAVVLSAPGEGSEAERPLDAIWEDFLPAAPFTEFIPAEPARAINILFSSGTTGDPKAIPWDHATAIKAAADGHFHQDIRPGDVVAWPTNLGWMMGPWLIFAALLNRAAIALYEGAPGTRGFCKFVEEAGVTMLGVIPSIVKAWISTKATAGCDWSALRAFSSTGECSAPADMAWLMAQPGGRGRPVIEYCGGTEIGGGYITNVIAEPCYPGHFNTPALGLDLVLLDEDGRPAPQGEVFLMPPSLGLSTRLLNADHDKIYYEGLPTGLRRHGDRIEALPGGQWRGHGRADDAMNLGGIKVSSAEIERALQVVPGLVESAAIAVSPDGGPSLLVIYAVAQGEREPLLQAMQAAIRRDLNPLFKIHDLVLVESLPRTATNKVMRRVLRDQYPPQEFPGPKSERNTIT